MFREARGAVQLPEGIKRPQDRQYEFPGIGAGGASFLPPLLLFELMVRIELIGIGVLAYTGYVRSILT